MANDPRQKTLFAMPETDDPTGGSHSPKHGLSDARDEGLEETAQATPPPSSLSGKSVYVIDAHNLIYQLFHALPEMTGPRGEPLGAVFGFARDLFYLLDEKQPDYLFAAFDMPGGTFRHEIYEQYKANRKAMPDDLVPQIGSIRRMLRGFRIPALGCPDYEADDVLATVARMTEELGGRCYLVTSDKDCRQLITEHVALYNIRKDQVFDAAALEKEWGIRPEQVVDFQALTGDTTDSVPGIPSIGPGYAKKLLQKYGTLEKAIENKGEGLGPKRQQLFNEHASLHCSAPACAARSARPVDIDWQVADRGRRCRPAYRPVSRVQLPRAHRQGGSPAAEIDRTTARTKSLLPAGRQPPGARGVCHRTRAAEDHFVRYGNDERLAPLGADRRLQLRMEA